MSNIHKRRPDYAALFPGVEIPSDVLAYLKANDRRLEYFEHDLKRNRYVRGKDGKPLKGKNDQPILLPEREVSLDKLMTEGWDFASAEQSIEESVICKFERSALKSALLSLSSSEIELVDALFFRGLTEREYSAESGIPQKTINDRKRKILGKLRNYLRN